MTSAQQLGLMSVEDYLAWELASPVKYEFLDGRVYAMTDTRNVHNIVAGNILGLLHARLRGRRCRPWNSDTKIRLRLPTHWRFYYPDVSVVCQPNPPDDSFQDSPVAIFEVLSRATRRIDEGEKKDSYLTIPTLGVYCTIEQETAAVVLYRRTEHGFVREVYEGLQAILPLPEIETDLPLAEIYDGVVFLPEAEGVDE